MVFHKIIDGVRPKFEAHFFINAEKNQEELSEKKILQGSGLVCAGCSRGMDEKGAGKTELKAFDKAFGGQTFGREGRAYHQRQSEMTRRMTKTSMRFI